MNACTNPHDGKLRHWYRAKARHAEPTPKAKRRLHNIRAIRAERMRRVVLWGVLTGVEL